MKTEGEDDQDGNKPTTEAVKALIKKLMQVISEDEGRVQQQQLSKRPRIELPQHGRLPSNSTQTSTPGQTPRIGVSGESPKLLYFR